MSLCQTCGFPINFGLLFCGVAVFLKACGLLVLDLINWKVACFWLVFAKFCFAGSFFSNFMAFLLFQFGEKRSLAGFCVYLLILGLFFRIYLHAFVFDLVADFLFCSVFLPNAFSACLSDLLAYFCKITWHHWSLQKWFYTSGSHFLFAEAKTILITLLESRTKEILTQVNWHVLFYCRTKSVIHTLLEVLWKSPDECRTKGAWDLGAVCDPKNSGRVARLALLVPNLRNLVLNNTCWPQIFRLALFQDRLAPCKNYIWPPWVLSEKPYFFTFLTDCRFYPNSYILKVLITKFCWDALSFCVNVKVSSSEYLLLAAVVEVAVTTVTLTNLLLFRWCQGPNFKGDGWDMSPPTFEQRDTQHLLSP